LISSKTKGVGSHSGIGRIQDSESRFREILDRVSRYIAGYVDAPLVAPRYLQLPDIFSPIRQIPHQSSLSQSLAEARTTTPFDNEPESTSQTALASQVVINWFLSSFLSNFDSLLNLWLCIHFSDGIKLNASIQSLTLALV